MNISKVEFGSLLTYAPRGTSEKANMARTVMTYLKNDRVMKSGNLFSEHVAQIIKRDIKKLPFLIPSVCDRLYICKKYRWSKISGSI